MLQSSGLALSEHLPLWQNTVTLTTTHTAMAGGIPRLRCSPTKLHPDQDQSPSERSLHGVRSQSNVGRCHDVCACWILWDGSRPCSWYKPPAPYAHDVSLQGPTPGIIMLVQVWKFFSERIRFEERQLRRMFGNQYENYAACTPTLIPFIA